jgi:redox-sensing transcriptional repressor
MSDSNGISPLTLNRLSVYLRCLRTLEREGKRRVSSQELAERFQLSSAQIRKDLAHFGEFGVRGVGYDVPTLAEMLHQVLGLGTKRRLIIVGMGNLGSALAAFLGFNDTSFHVVAGADSDVKRIGRRVGSLTVEPFAELAAVVARSKAEIAVLAVPPEAAQDAYDRCCDAGIRAILNFAPFVLQERPGVRIKNVDMRIHLEEMSFFLEESEHGRG